MKFLKRRFNIINCFSHSDEFGGPTHFIYVFPPKNNVTRSIVNYELLLINGNDTSENQNLKITKAIFDANGVPTMWNVDLGDGVSFNIRDYKSLISDIVSLYYYDDSLPNHSFEWNHAVIAACLLNHKKD